MPLSVHRHATTKPHLLAIFATLLIALPLHAQSNPLSAANRLLQHGHADEAINALHPLLVANPHNGAAHLLLCRALFAKQQNNDAANECEAAVANLPSSSEAQDWLGRAYGRKADQSGPIAGLRLAGKVVNAFEAAVRLNPHSSDAVNDLSEYYVNAPGMVGGGVDKALALADRSADTLPQSAHRIRALAAEKSGDNAKAEAEFRAATAVANRPDAWVDLGNFYARIKHNSLMLDALQHAIAATHTPDSNYVDAAQILIHNRFQHPELAEQWLRAYIDGNAQTDAAPVPLALTELGTLLAHNGDKDGARDQATKALALASGYEPAQKLLHSL